MADYFSNIVSRNSEIQPEELAPSQNLMQESDSDLETIIDENIVSNEYFSAKKSEKLNLNSQNQSVNSRATTITPSNYFSNTYNRNIHKIIGTGINDPAGFEAFDPKNNEIIKTNIISQNPDSNNINDGDIIEKNIYEQENRNMQATIIKKEIAIKPRSNIKQTLEPNQNFDNHFGFTKNLLQPQNKLETTQKISPNRETPKLVIGKINVEIIPATQPLTKIINRITATPPNNFSNKTNRLNFGLGQL